LEEEENKGEDWLLIEFLSYKRKKSNKKKKSYSPLQITHGQNLSKERVFKLIQYF